MGSDNRGWCDFSKFCGAIYDLYPIGAGLVVRVATMDAIDLFLDVRIKFN